MNGFSPLNEPVLFQTKQKSIAKYLTFGGVGAFAAFWIIITLFATIAFSSLTKTVPEGMGTLTVNGIVYKRIGDRYEIGSIPVTREQFLIQVQKQQWYMLLFVFPFWLVGAGLLFAAAKVYQKSYQQEVTITASKLYLTKFGTNEIIKEIPLNSISKSYVVQSFYDQFIGTGNLTIEQGSDFDVEALNRQLTAGLVISSKTAFTQPIFIPFLEKSFETEQTLRPLIKKS